MTSKLTDSLRGMVAAVAGRLGRRRAVESAAICAASAGPAAIATGLSLAYAREMPWLGLVPLLTGVIVGGLIVWFRARLDPSSIVAFAAGLSAAGNGLAGAFLVSSGAGIPSRLLVSLLMLIVGGVCGLVAGIIRMPSLTDAARWCDSCLGLEDRATAALESARRRGEDSEVTRCITRQAVEAISAADIPSARLWERGPGTWASLALAIVVTVGVSVAPIGLDHREDLSTVLAGMLDQLPADQRARLAESLRQARRASDDRGVSETLGEAAVVALQGDDPQRLRELLEELRQAGVEVRDMLPADVLAAAEARLRGGGGGGGERGTDANDLARRPDSFDASPGGVRVFDPAYDTNAKAAIDPGSGWFWRPAEDAWADARRQATEGLRTGSIPMRYRQLIRNYYAGQSRNGGYWKSEPRGADGT